MTEKDSLIAWLRDDFGPEHEDYIGLCLDETGTQPLFYNHLAAVEASCNFSDLSESSRQELKRGYIYLSAYYFCIDAIIDGHNRGISAHNPQTQVSPFVGPLLVASILHLSKGCEEIKKGYALCVLSEIHDLLSKNALSLKYENKFRGFDAKIDPADEFKSIVGRANLFIFLYKLIFSLYDRALPKAMEADLKNFIYFMQLGDDLGDWRDDFRDGRVTSFLRKCREDIGEDLTEEVLESHIYLSAAYEERLVEVIVGLNAICENARKHSMPGFERFVFEEVQEAKASLSDFVNEKLAVQFGGEQSE